MLLEVLRRTHLSSAADLSAIFSEESRRIGVRSLVVYLIDVESRMLVPVPGPDTGDRAPLAVGGTLGGRSFASGVIVPTDTGLWVPLLDGTERLGVVEYVLSGPAEPELVTACERYAHFMAMLVATKDAYSDVFKGLRRRTAMTPASELVRDSVPPATIATEDLVLGAMLEPAYDIGGDAYDYALNDAVLHLGIFDGVGHGLAAAGITTFSVALYRHARRHGLSLAETYSAVDVALEEQDWSSRYVTACLAELDVTSGRLRWVAAGHPPPLLLRQGRFVRELSIDPSPPLGLRLIAEPCAVAEEALEPGDMVLFYTDGLTEARRPDGRLFTVERLAEFIERQAGSGAAAPDTLRRLREAIIERGEGALRDDATAMLLEWRRGSQRALLPHTVL